jgi:hypothetical protein
MRRLIRDWWFGFRLLVRLVIALLCLTVGSGMFVGLQLILPALHLSMPYYVYLFLQVLYVLILCPFILSSYARYCGFAPRPSEHPQS